jgi:hypothetical protein
MMKKNPTIILKSTLALLLIISISFAAKSQPIVNPEKVEPYSYSRDDEFFSFDMTKLVNLDEATSAGLHITGLSGNAKIFLMN